MPRPEAPNDRIHAAAEAIGYCCPYGFFGCNQRKSDSYTKLGKKLSLSKETIKFNLRKIRQGKLACEKKEGCRRDEFQPGYRISPTEGDSDAS